MRTRGQACTFGCWGREGREAWSSCANTWTPGHAPVLSLPSLWLPPGAHTLCWPACPRGCREWPRVFASTAVTVIPQTGRLHVGRGRGSGTSRAGVFGEAEGEGSVSVGRTRATRPGGFFPPPPGRRARPLPASDARALERNTPRAGCWAACVVSVFSPVRAQLVFGMRQRMEHAAWDHPCPSVTPAQAVAGRWRELWSVEGARSKPCPHLTFAMERPWPVAPVW